MIVKENWTDEDFVKMKWTDCHIHAISFPDEKSELKLDIDYIFDPGIGEKTSKDRFWVSPCSLSFFNVQDLNVKGKFEEIVGFNIQQISRSNSILSSNRQNALWDYTIKTDGGTIALRASGFILKVEKQPVLNDDTVLDRPEC
ncbi:MAG: hypothetical protein LBQ60_03710 [Bacteroidales bacterium]|jgi:hypothetical protein|nr:hypothetical protein [Bacteroidales bacterium]